MVAAKWYYFYDKDWWSDRNDSEDAHIVLTLGIYHSIIKTAYWIIFLNYYDEICAEYRSILFEDSLGRLIPLLFVILNLIKIGVYTIKCVIRPSIDRFKEIFCICFAFLVVFFIMTIGYATLYETIIWYNWVNFILFYFFN